MYIDFVCLFVCVRVCVCVFCFVFNKGTLNIYDKFNALKII